MRKYLIILLFPFLFSSYELKLIDGFPIWLKDGEKRTDQTSGITFIGNQNHKNVFLVCDDIGKIHRIELKDKEVKIKTIDFDKDLKDFLLNFEKQDFEEIVYDKFTGDIYLSIEGNGPDFKNEVGIYKVKFKDNDMYKNEIVKIEKVKFPEWERISKYTDNNIGFEGLGVSRTKMFLGLEGFQYGDIFLDSTMLYVVDKESKKLLKEISTKSFNIHTICGLYAVDDYKIFGIDRNQQNLFVIEFDKDYNVKSHSITKLELPTPSKRNLKYVAAIESITLDNDNFIYVVDDPYKKFYVPPVNVLEQLTETDRKNFKEFIPLLFKYKLN
jgi:hypothetical protein